MKTLILRAATIFIVTSASGSAFSFDTEDSASKSGGAVPIDIIYDGGQPLRLIVVFKANGVTYKTLYCPLFRDDNNCGFPIHLLADTESFILDTEASTFWLEHHKCQKFTINPDATSISVTYNQPLADHPTIGTYWGATPVGDVYDVYGHTCHWQ